jgi:hypothetical protein
MKEPRTQVAELAQALRRGLEGRDAALLGKLYAEDAEVRIVNRNQPPGNPRVLRGREAITAHLRDVTGRDLTHRITQEVIGDDALAYVIDCRYGTGQRVIATAVDEIQDGQIRRELIVEAWDE